MPTRTAVLVGLFLLLPGAASASDPCPDPEGRPTLDGDLGLAVFECGNISHDLFVLEGACFEQGGKRKPGAECDRAIRECEADRAIERAHEAQHNLNAAALGDIRGGWLGQAYPVSNPNIFKEYDSDVPCRPNSLSELTGLSKERQGISQRHQDVANEWRSWWPWAQRVAAKCRKDARDAQAAQAKTVADRKADENRSKQDADRNARQAASDKAAADRVAAQQAANNQVVQDAVAQQKANAARRTQAPIAGNQTPAQAAGQQLGEALNGIGTALQDHADAKRAAKLKKEQNLAEADEAAFEAEWAERERLEALPPGFVFVNSTPAGAVIFVDHSELDGNGSTRIVTPTQIKMTPIEHEIEVRLAGYQPAKATVEMGSRTAGARLDFALKPEPPQFRVASRCKGQRVLVAIDGVPAVPTTDTGPPVFVTTAGEHRLTLSGKGCVAREERVSAAGGRPVGSSPVIAGDLATKSLFSGEKGTPPKTDPGLIVPGVGADGITIGKSTIEDVRRAYGRGDEHPGYVSFGYEVAKKRKTPQTITFDGLNKTISKISYGGGDRSHRTAGGAGPGTSEKLALEEFGAERDEESQSCCRTYRWESMGVEIVVSADDGEISSLEVFAAAPPPPPASALVAFKSWRSGEIVPGIGANGVQVGLSGLSEYRAAFGASCREEPAVAIGDFGSISCQHDSTGRRLSAEENYDRWKQFLPSLVFFDHGVMTSMSFNTELVWTVAGLPLGCTEADVTRKFGPPEKREDDKLQYPSRGIDITIDKNKKRCTWATVYLPEP